MNSGSPGLLENFAGCFVNFIDSAVDFSDFFWNVILLVTLWVLLFCHCVCDIRHDLDVLVSFLWLSLQCWIVQPDNNDWNVICWSSHHGLKQKCFRRLAIPFFLFKTWLMNLFDNFNSFFILNFVPKAITSNNDKIVIFNSKTGDFWFANDNLWSRLLCFKISKSSCSRKSARENSQRPNNLVIIPSVSLSDSCGLIDFSSGCNDSFLLVRIWRFMIFADLIKLLKALACQNGSWISQICNVASVLVNEGY